MRTDSLTDHGRYLPLIAAATVLALLVCAAGLASGTAARKYHVPASIASDCSQDVTDRVLEWIASRPNDSVLSFRRAACYRIDGTLALSNRKGLVFEGNGSMFRARTPPTRQREMWLILDSRNIRLTNMKLDGGYRKGGTFNSAVQGAAGISLQGSNVDIGGVTITNVGGDCVYFGQGLTSARTRSSGSFHDSSCARTGRNGVAVVAGDNVLVQRTSLTTIGYNVFDVEPNPGGNYGSNGAVFDSNTIGTFAMNVYSLVESGPISNQSFTNNRVIGRGLKVAVGDPTGGGFRPQAVTITGNSSDTPQPPSPINVDNVDGLTITGNTVPMTAGAMAAVTGSCRVTISRNRYPGGRSQLWLRPAACS
jgi:hypothetical protein